MPIHKVTNELLIAMMKTMRHMDRDYKHTIGQHMIMITLEMLAKLRIARDIPSKRLDCIIDYLGLYDNLQVLLKDCVDDEHLGLKVIRQDDYIQIIPKLASAERQAVGWLRTLENPNDSTTYPEFADRIREE